MQTTAPLSGTGAESVADGLAIRWVHPRLRADTPLEGGSLTLGREPTNEVVLDGITTSRRHAQILRRGNTFAIRDLGGQNGAKEL